MTRKTAEAEQLRLFSFVLWKIPPTPKAFKGFKCLEQSPLFSESKLFTQNR